MHVFVDLLSFLKTDLLSGHYKLNIIIFFSKCRTLLFNKTCTNDKVIEST